MMNLEQRMNELIEKYDFCRVRLCLQNGDSFAIWAVPVSQEYSDLIDSDASQNETVIFRSVENEPQKWGPFPLGWGDVIAAKTCGEFLPEAIINDQLNNELIVAELMYYENKSRKI